VLNLNSASRMCVVSPEAHLIERLGKHMQFEILKNSNEVQTGTKQKSCQICEAKPSRMEKINV
jgi:hypothetical protein